MVAASRALLPDIARPVLEVLIRVTEENKKRGVVMKKPVAVFLFSCCFALLFSFGISSVHAQGKVITLKLSTFFPAMHQATLSKAEWGKEVEKRTGGRVKIDIYPGGILTPPAQTYESLTKGITDVGESVFAYTPGRFPLMEVTDLPLGIKSAAQGTRLANEVYRKFKPKELDAVKVMWLWTSGPQFPCTKQPVAKLEEMKGLKLRSTGTSAGIVQALGGAPVGMTMGEAYDAIAKGVVNGLFIPLEPLKGWKLAEVVNYCTAWDAAGVNAVFIIMNKKKWEAIPKDLQQIIEKVNEEWIEKEAKMWNDMDTEGEDVLKKKGGKVLHLSAQESQQWRKQVQPLIDAYINRMKSKGLPGAEAVTFCHDYLRTH